MSDVTRILLQIESGDRSAAEQLLPLVYEELRKLAAAQLAQEKPGQTLQATALVHEAYLLLVGDHEFADRRHFFRVAAEAMRRILIDRARRKLRRRHGGHCERVPLDNDVFASEVPAEELLALDEALEKLSAIDPQKADLIKLRYFVGFSEEETAKALGISRATASRYWTFSRAWLINALGK
jgi:RNA polymerase sigma factor (TIGR02999 family)